MTAQDATTATGQPPPPLVPPLLTLMIGLMTALALAACMFVGAGCAPVVNGVDDRPPCQHDMADIAADMADDLTR